ESCWRKGKNCQDIEALDGSCVFIPCSFKEDHQCCTNQIGVWISNDPWKGNEVFRKDTSSDTWKNVRVTIGDVNVRNCSTQLDRVGPQQEGTYYFRTEGKLKKTFNKNAVSIKVTGKREPLITPVVPVVEGTATSLTCSAPSSCPSDPPVLTWSDTLNGAKTEESKGEKGAKVTSVLRFTASHVHHSKTVTCTASSRGQRWTNTVTLNVTYSPRNTSISGHPVHNIPEGGAVTLSCTSNANPPSSYSWYHQRGSSVTRRGSGQELTITKVTLGDGGLYYCEAKNQHGGENSTAVTVNVQYPPTHVTITGHTVDNIPEGGAVTLSCSSDANPPGSYSWYQVSQSSVTRRGSGQSLTIANVTPSDGVFYYCEAKNEYGAENSTAVTIEVKCRYSPTLVIMTFLKSCVCNRAS
uniref:Ig-like domain-containing protein n=1 Tax=Erpetoichthys calabaricus TaxID=27687 RepID=A0A8C4TA19_ERPCA